MSKKSQTVLIGTTLNPAGDPLVASGVRLARSMGARIHLVHAYELSLLPGGIPSVVERMDQQIARLGIGREEIAEITFDLGAPHQVLVEAARRSDADLIVLGAVESGEALSRLLGSTADRVVRKADRPVLLVREGLAVPLQRVLLPVGLSGRTAEALEEGLDLLNGMEGGHDAEIEALFVSAEVDGRPARGQSVPEQIRRTAAGRLDGFLATALAGSRSDTDWRIGSRVAFGFIDREILNRIERWQPDLVVLRTHDREEIEPFLLGRVTMALMRQEGASVLVIPPVAARATMMLPRVMEAAVSVAA